MHYTQTRILTEKIHDFLESGEYHRTPNQAIFDADGLNSERPLPDILQPVWSGENAKQLFDALELFISTDVPVGPAIILGCEGMDYTVRILQNNRLSIDVVVGTPLGIIPLRLERI